MSVTFGSYGLMLYIFFRRLAPQENVLRRLIINTESKPGKLYTKYGRSMGFAAKVLHQIKSLLQFILS